MSHIAFGSVVAVLCLLVVVAGSVAGQSATGVEVEPNDLFATATPIEPDTRVTGQVFSLFYADAYLDDDYFAVPVERGQTVTIDVSRAAGYGTLYVTLYDPDGYSVGQYASVGGGDSVRVRATAAQTGVHYVGVSGWLYFVDTGTTLTDGGFGSYTLLVGTGGTDANEPNDARASATVVGADGRLAGAVSSWDDEDWFAFDARAGDTVTLWTDEATTAPMFVDLYGSGAAPLLLDRVDDGWRRTVTADGTHYVRVASNGDRTGDYDLRVELTRAADPTEDGGADAREPESEARTPASRAEPEDENTPTESELLPVGGDGDGGNTSLAEEWTNPTTVIGLLGVLATLIVGYWQLGNRRGGASGG